MKSTTFKLTALALAVSVSLLGSFSVQAAEPASTPQATQPAQKSNFLATVPWDAEYDVIVLGYGLAGGTAAIAAADKGSKVLLSEKAPQGHEGGNSKYSAQRAIMIQPDYPDEKAVKFMQQLRGDFKNPTDETILALYPAIKVCT